MLYLIDLLEALEKHIPTRRIKIIVDNDIIYDGFISDVKKLDEEGKPCIPLEWLKRGIVLSMNPFDDCNDENDPQVNWWINLPIYNRPIKIEII